ncbi:MAG TPA: GNAT family N-acetyltransferase [Dongiaceae bacterium]|nr:GNAT family N-acetyltransferase [Dongiaceae bacterium]
MNISVINSDDLDYIEFSGLQQEAFADVPGQKERLLIQTPDYYRWKYAAPAGKAKIALARIDGELVAANAMFPLTISAGPTRISGWQSCDTATLPKARGKWLFSKCLHELKAVLGQDEFFFGYPNKNSEPGFRKFRWTTIDQLNFYVFAGLGRASAGTIVCLNDRLDRFAPHLKGFMTNDMVAIERSYEFLNWRYLNHPVYTYQLFGYIEQEQLLGYIVLRKVRFSHVKFGLILECWAHQDVVRTSLYKFAEKWSSRNGCHATMVLAINNPIKTSLTARFIKVPERLSPRKFLLMGDVQPILHLQENREWVAFAGDWDGF